MLTMAGMRARARRLEELARGLGREAEAVRRGGPCVLTAAERRQYLNGIHDAIAGAEAARVALAKAVKRLERSELSEEAAADEVA